MSAPWPRCPEHPLLAVLRIIPFGEAEYGGRLFYTHGHAYCPDCGRYLGIVEL